MKNNNKSAKSASSCLMELEAAMAAEKDIKCREAIGRYGFSASFSETGSICGLKNKYLKTHIIFPDTKRQIRFRNLAEILGKCPGENYCMPERDREKINDLVYDMWTELRLLSM